MRRVLVNNERVALLRRFEEDLVELCREFNVEIRASPESADTIEVIECDFKYPKGYAFSACFTGVNPRRLWNTVNEGGCARRGMVIERYWTED